jgi:hypothetical protein
MLGVKISLDRLDDVCLGAIEVLLSDSIKLHSVPVVSTTSCPSLSNEVPAGHTSPAPHAWQSVALLLEADPA